MSVGRRRPIGKRKPKPGAGSGASTALAALIADFALGHVRPPGGTRVLRLFAFVTPQNSCVWPTKYFFASPWSADYGRWKIPPWFLGAV